MCYQIIIRKIYGKRNVTQKRRKETKETSEKIMSFVKTARWAVFTLFVVYFSL